MRGGAMAKLVILLAAIVLTAGAGYCGPAETTETQDSILGTENGRYVFGQLPDGDKYMLDVRTGRLWVLEEDPDTNQRVLSIVPYENIKGKRSVGPRDIENLAGAVVDD